MNDKENQISNNKYGKEQKIQRYRYEIRNTLIQDK